MERGENRDEKRSRNLRIGITVSLVSFDTYESRRGRIAFYVFPVGSRTPARKLSIVDVTGQEKSRTSCFTRIVVTKRISCYAESQSSTLFDSLRRLRSRSIAQMCRSISTIRKLRLIEKLQATLDEPLRYAAVGDFPRDFSPVVVRKKI